MKRYLISFITILCGLLLLVVVNINSGSIDLSVGEIFNILAGKDGNDTAYHIVMDIRLPRILASLFLGGSLAVSGFLLQTFFRNPIAGPYILGISSGAKLTVALTLIVFLQRGIKINSLGMIVAAFIGSMLAMIFVLVISQRVKNMSILIVCGIMIGYICSAITDFVVTFADDANIINLHNWSLGSFSGISWRDVYSIIIIVCMVVCICFMLSKPIGAYQLGEEYARNMGVNIKAVRVAMILLSSVLSATVTAFAGPISFVGIAVPHLVKLILKTTKPIVMIPGCFLLGAAITLMCDGISRTVFSPVELSISSVTAIILVPVVISMMLKKSK